MVVRKSEQWWEMWLQLREQWDSHNSQIEGLCHDDWEVMSNVLDLIHVAKNVVYRKYVQVRDAESNQRQLDECTEEATNDTPVQEMSD